MVEMYRGSFVSVEGVKYDVVIKGVDESVAAPGELIFAADTPVRIEWAEVDKIEPVQGSSLTLTLVSEEDRKYVDLYTVEPGAIVAEVYRDGALYWTGALDAELYEEPYAWKSDYEVEFTFSDFALLERKSWDKTGASTMDEVLSVCLNAAGLGDEDVVKLVSTEMRSSAGNKVIDMGELWLANDNFYDEEGEAKTYREVLEAVLQPFALRMVQKGGKVYIYDLNALYAGMDAEKVWWKSDDAVFGADVVYNDVVVTFSPYADAELINGELDHDDVLPGKLDSDGRLWLMSYDTANDPADGFKMWYGAQDDLGLTLENGAMFFRIDSVYSGSDEAGVLAMCKGNNYQTNYNSYLCGSQPKDAYNDGTHSIIKTQSAFLGYVGGAKGKYQLKIELSVLFDVRYNPFESAGKYNEEGDWGRLNDWANFGYIPVMLYLKDANGNVKYHYENVGVMKSNGYTQNGLCGWQSGAGSWGCMWLAYYDFENRKSASGFGGWKKNRQVIGYYRDDLPSKWSARGEGEFIDLPEEGGWLELQIGGGLHHFDYKRSVKSDLFGKARWLMYKAPVVTFVKANGTTMEQEDVEDTAWVNKSAKEEYSIDTIVGTLGTNVASASARGLVMDAQYGAITEFGRAGVWDRLERLLIGTVYSQYASRKATLTGTVRLLPQMKVLRDEDEGVMMKNKRFVLLSESQDLMQDESEVKMAEFVADSYEGIDYK
jgi:hypothetical protein